MHASCSGGGALKIPFVLENGRIVVEADVNGTTGRFIWDSGSNVSLVNCRFDNLQYVDNRRSFWVGGNGEYATYIINEMTVGGVRVKSQSNIALIPEDMRKQQLEPYGFEGILGIETFNGYWCEISFSQNTFILHKEKPARFTQSVSAANVERFFTMPIDVDGISYPFLVDTGAPNTILPPATIQSKEEGGYIKAESANGDYYAVKTQSITVFNDTFKERYFLTDVPKSMPMFRGETRGIIGLDALRNYDLLFDLTGTDSSREMRSRETRVYYKPRNEFEDRIIGSDRYAAGECACGS
jgi:hypothetical protein